MSSAYDEECEMSGLRPLDVTDELSYSDVDIHCQVSDTGVQCQTDLTCEDIGMMQDEINRLTSENVSLKKRIAEHEISQETFKDDDDKVKFYTGLPSFAFLMLYFGLLSEHINISSRSVLSKFQQFVIVLMRLRLDLSVQDLAYRFSVSTSTVSRIFTTVLDIMYQRSSFLVKWPSREELRDTMPVEFRASFGLKVAVIIDCFEVFIERPSNLMAQAQTWSNYKHHNTVKFLIGITPQGSISYISPAWGGRVSDKKLTESCGFLDYLLPGDLVLADRGFDISDSVGLMCAEVKIPAFMKGRKQLSVADVISTRKIAHVRIHVERVIGVLRRRYSILGGTLPTDYMLNKDSDGKTVLDKIAHVCCALTNLGDSVVPFD